MHKNLCYRAENLHSTMRSIPSAQQDNIITLLTSGHSNRAVASQTGVSRTKVANIAKEMLPDKENLRGGRPTKLSPADRRAISMQIQTGKTENAV